MLWCCFRVEIRRYDPQVMHHALEPQRFGGFASCAFLMRMAGKRGCRRHLWWQCAYFLHVVDDDSHDLASMVHKLTQQIVCVQLNGNVLQLAVASAVFAKRTYVTRDKMVRDTKRQRLSSRKKSMERNSPSMLPVVRDKNVTFV